MVKPKHIMASLMLSHYVMWSVTIANTQMGEHQLLDPKTTWVSLGIYVTSLCVAMATTWKMAAWYHDRKRQVDELNQKYQKLINKIDNMHDKYERDNR